MFAAASYSISESLGLSSTRVKSLDEGGRVLRMKRRKKELGEMCGIDGAESNDECLGAKELDWTHERE